MKKGIFVPALAVFTLIILVALSYTITYAEDKKGDVVTGKTSIGLINLYNEGEKLSFYLDEAVKLSLRNTEEILKNNAGYSKVNNCKKQNGIIIWNRECDYFNVDENFNKQFKEELIKYVKVYPQQLPEPIITDNKVEFRNIKFQKQIISPLIKTFSAEYKINEEIEFTELNLDIYKNIYYVAQQCDLKQAITNNEINYCINNLKTVPNTKITRNQDNLEIINNDIKIIINVKEKLPLPKKSITITE